MEEKLLERYLELDSKGVRPKDAWYIDSPKGREYIKSAIPFVGKNYAQQKLGRKVLLYASAENLVGYGPSIVELVKDSGMTRCRDFFNGSNEFFPNIHIQPINDGGLLVAAYQILKRFVGEWFSEEYEEMSPRDFLECVCCANYGKFSLHSEDGKNVDYGNRAGMDVLEACHEYIRADIEVLKPDIIILPAGIYHAAKQKEFLLDVAEGKDIKFIPIYQINARVVNCVMYPAMMKNKYGTIFTYDMLSENELKWHEGVKRINKDKFLSIYPYISSLNI